MADINESPLWEDVIELIGRTERVSGGQDGVANRPLKKLANRTRYLKERFDETDADISSKVEAVKTFDEGRRLILHAMKFCTEITDLSGQGGFLKTFRRRRRPSIPAVSVPGPGHILLMPQSVTTSMPLTVWRWWVSARILTG